MHHQFSADLGSPIPVVTGPGVRRVTSLIEANALVYH